MKKAMLVLALSFLACVCSGSLCDSPQPGPGNCAGGTDVRQVNDSAIPQAIREALHYQAGPITSRQDPQNPSQPNPKYPSGKVVLIPFETPDFPRNPAITAAYLSQVFFASGSLSGPSVYHYFRENSWGQFLIANGGISDWVTINKNLTAYLGFEGEDDLPRDVLRLANINWAGLDTDHDNTITAAEAQIVFIVCNGYSAATRGFVNYPPGWAPGDPPPPAVDPLAAVTPSGTYNFKPPVVYIGAKTASDPSASTNAIRIMSTICHELGHAFFNLPDRYAGSCGSGWTGQYEMMSDNCDWRHFNIHDKMKIGWIQPKIVASHLDQCLAFPNSANSPAALVLLPPETPSRPLSAGEYWIVENRHKPSSLCGCVLITQLTPYSQGVFDVGLPESGLAIWWVRAGTWLGGHDEVRLVDAALPDQDPDGSSALQEPGGPTSGYRNQGAGALFKRNDADPKRLLMDSSGGWSLLFLERASEAGPTMYVEF
jgi:M6 family metalloprotease-like protein